MFDIPDLFAFDEDDKIVAENNGLSSARKISFKKKIRSENRNSEFAEIMKTVGGLPKTEEAVLIKTNGCSDTGGIFGYILENSKPLDELYLSTWIISRDNIEMILKALDNGELNKLVFVVSKRLKELKKSIYSFLVEEFLKRPDKISFKVCNSHAKTFSVSDLEGNFYTITGSGNWTENPRIENYILLNDFEAFNHNKEWMTEITK